jgi:hypothetical protein
MNINLSFLLTALAIFINFSLVKTRTEFFSPETSIETEVENATDLPPIILSDFTGSLDNNNDMEVVVRQVSYLLTSLAQCQVHVNDFFTVFPSDIPPPLS